MGARRNRQISVIADDLTGATELGGVGFRYGLRSEVRTIVGGRFSSELISLDTNSRSRLESESVRRVVSAADHFQSLGTDFIYKKVDSAMRGRIVAEIGALMKALGKNRVLLIPANPSLNRVIRDGHYYIDGVPIDQTGFRSDPEYPCRSSSVVKLLGPNGPYPVAVCRVDEPMPEAAIVVGEVSTRKELHAWASRLDETILPAGAAEFFAAILEARGLQVSPFRSGNGVVVPDEPETASGFGERTADISELFVCGSASDSTRRFLSEGPTRGIPLFSMPEDFFGSDARIEGARKRWLEKTLSAIHLERRAIVAIDRPLIPDPAIAERLLSHLIDHVEAVLAAAAIGRVFVEGGATAAELLRRMDWTRLNVAHEFAQGVVSLLPFGKSRPVVTMKPGSYSWAPELLRKPS